MSQDVLDAIAVIGARMDRIEQSLAEVRALVGPFGTVFPDGSLLVQSIHGNKYFIDPSDEIMAPQLVIYRQWEADLSRYVINSVTPDCVFVDVGANFGYFTCLAGSRIGTNGTGQVISFEPNPKMFELLQRNVGINWSLSPTTLHRCAVTDKAGFAEFHIPPTRAANASLSTRPASGQLDQVLVKACALDDLTGDLKVDILKIDVEGFEAMVFRGGEQTIRRSANINIVMEWSPEQMHAAGFSVDDLSAIFEAFALVPHRMPASRFAANDEWRALELNAIDLRTIGYDNLVLRKKATG